MGMKLSEETDEGGGKVGVLVRVILALERPQFLRRMEGGAVGNLQQSKVEKETR